MEVQSSNFRVEHPNLSENLDEIIFYIDQTKYAREQVFIKMVVYWKKKKFSYSIPESNTKFQYRGLSFQGSNIREDVGSDKSGEN